MNKLYTIKEVDKQFDDYDKVLKFKMAINDEDELNSLLTYYRDRINEFDNERNEWLEKLQEVRLNQEDKHKLEWELQKRKDEIIELQKYCTESKVILFNERQLVLKLTRENDELKLKELDDKKKIEELLSLTQPIEEQIILQKDIRPKINYKFSKNDSNIHHNKENSQKNLQKFGQNIGQSSKSIVKTIYVPNESLNSITQENENLKRQLEQERNIFTDHIKALQQELAIRDDEMKLRYNDDQKKYQEIQKKYQTLELQHQSLTQEFFKQRMLYNKQDQKLQEENELLRLRNTALGNKLLIAQKQSGIEQRAVEELAYQKSEEYVQKFRSQNMRKDDELQIMKDLEQSLTKLTEKYHQLEKKRTFEVESYKNTIKNLNKSEQVSQKSENKKQKHQKTKKQLSKQYQNDSNSEQIEGSQSVQMEELDQIKNQLNHIEDQLDD